MAKACASPADMAEKRETREGLVDGVRALTAQGHPDFEAIEDVLVGLRSLERDFEVRAQHQD